MTYEKPPIGVAPHWFVYWKRMLELSEAIGRYLEYIRIHENTMKLEQYYKAIASWSEELKALSELKTSLSDAEQKMLNDYLGLGSIDHLRELAEADRDGRCVVLPCKVKTLVERYNVLKFPTGDEAENYSTGYRNGHKNGQAELIEYLLGIDTDIRTEGAEKALEEHK